MKFNMDTAFWGFYDHVDRYIPGGYKTKDEMVDDVDKRLEIISNAEGITGLTLAYPHTDMGDDPDKILKKLVNYNLKMAYLEPDAWGDKKWKWGALSSTDAKLRKETVEFYKGAVDFCDALKADSILLWPAHDGFDYPFQADYRDGWKYMIDTVQQIGSYNPNVKIAIEYKQKDPRQKQYDSNVGRQMMMLNDIGLDNVGGIMDTGHAYMAGENLAEAIVILDSHSKLFQVHMNDNYRDADPDLIAGTISFWEYIEMFYYLNKTDYEGWCSLDVIPTRMNADKMMAMGARLMMKYKEIADKLTEHSEEIDNNLKGYKFTENMELIMDIAFGK